MSTILFDELKKKKTQAGAPLGNNKEEKCEPDDFTYHTRSSLRDR